MSDLTEKLAQALLSVKNSASDQFSKGAPYREALAQALQGNLQPANQLFNTKSYASPDEAANIGLGFAPMGLGTIAKSGLGNAIKELEFKNRMTSPKVPTNNVFMNQMGNLDTSLRMQADDAFANNSVNNQSVNIADIIPTQKNLTTPNIRSVENVTELPDLIKSNGKYYISDGHHRIARDILNGNQSVNARVVDFGAVK